MKNNMLHKVAMTLTIIGGINWGLIGFFDFDLVMMLFSSVEMLPTIIYDLVGLSALYLAFNCMSCSK